MVQRVRVSLVDDIDGSEATQTVPFELDGVKYEIDLSAEHALDLRHILSRYTKQGRRIGGKKAASRHFTANAPLKKAPQRTRADVQAIRAWATGNGYDLPDRGRIRNDVIEAYRRAHEKVSSS